MQLIVENLFKSYGDIKAVRNVSFIIESGKTIGLLGRNGAGKSTLIKCIIGILSPDSGKVLFDGKQLSDSNAKIGYLPEERGLYLNATVFDQLSYFAELNGVNKNVTKKEIERLLNSFEIIEYKHRKIKTLSKGNKQKVQLIAAIIHNPDILILDEPFSGLDPINGAIFKRILNELRLQGKAIILSSHRMEDIEELCDSVLMINEGVPVINDNIDTVLKENSNHNKVYLRIQGDNPENIFETLNFIYSLENDVYVIEYDTATQICLLQKKLLENNIYITEFRYHKASMTEIFFKGADKNEE